jgi:hypothetical protein
MKRIFISLIVLVFTLGLWAQENDSILLERVDVLKKELGVLNKKQRNLQYKLNLLKVAHEKDLQETESAFTVVDESIESNAAKANELDQALKDSEEKTLESLTILGEWTKKAIMILAIAALVLIIVLLILIVTNRRRIEKDYAKLEAKVDNTKEALEIEIRDMLRKHEEEISALKSAVEKGEK